MQSAFLAEYPDQHLEQPQELQEQHMFRLQQPQQQQLGPIDEFNQVKSFYSVDNGSNQNHLQDQSIIPQYDKQLQPSNQVTSGYQFQPIANQLEQQQQQQQHQQQFSMPRNPFNYPALPMMNQPEGLTGPSNFNHLNYDTIQEAISNFNRQSEIVQQQQQQQQNRNAIPKLSYLAYPEAGPRLLQNHGLAANHDGNNSTSPLHNSLAYTKGPSSGSSSANNRKRKSKKVKAASNEVKKQLEIPYKHSLLLRPKVVNLTSLLKPGQVLLSERDHLKSREKTSRVKLRDIQKIAEQLKPLAVGHFDKPEAEQLKLEQENDDNDENERDEDGEEMEEDVLEKLRQSKREKNLGLVLPTSHIFGNLLGVVNDSRLSGGVHEQQDSLNSYEDNHRHQSKSAGREKFGSASANEDQISFLKALADLTMDSQKKRRKNLEDSELDEQNDLEFFELTKRPEAARAPREAEESQESASIPIDLLVDHLMSGSRTATFGLQHRDSASMQPEAEAGEDEEEDDEDNNGTLPNEAFGDMVNQESERVEQQLAVPGMNGSASVPKMVDFDWNNTNSWVPLNSIVGKPLKFNESSSSKVHRKIKRSRRDKPGSKSDLNLIIGQKALSRNDLVRLIRVLNKMASQKEPSRQREASRKLLKFLIKLALSEYKRTAKGKGDRKEIGSNNSGPNPLIRSLLMGPSDELEAKSGNNSVIELRSIGFLPKARRVVEKPAPEEEANVDDRKESGSGSVSPEASQSQRRREAISAKRNQNQGSTLRDLSDELENYFDSDFFEDMADKLKSSNFTKVPYRAERLPRRLAKSSSSSHHYGGPPVPIYGQQLMEAADEDDVDLDHVQVPMAVRPKVRRKRKQGVDRTRKRKRRRKILELGESESPEAEEDEEEEEEDNLRKSPAKEFDSKKSKRQSKKRLDGDSKQEASSNRETSDQEELEEEEEPERNESLGDGNQASGNAERDTREEADSGSNKEPNPDGLKQERARRGKKVRPRRRKKMRIDLDSRYEIPAPIEKDKTVFRAAAVKPTKKAPVKLAGEEEDRLKSSSRKRNKNKRDELKEQSEPAKASKAAKRTGKNAKKEAKGARGAKRIDRSLREGARRDRKGLRSEPAPKGTRNLLEGEPGDEDSDYYNEGTSFSKTCDDNGNCKVIVKSTNPKLSDFKSKGINERQLDNWARSEPD